MSNFVLHEIEKIPVNSGAPFTGTGREPESKKTPEFRSVPNSNTHIQKIDLTKRKFSRIMVRRLGLGLVTRSPKKQPYDSFSETDDSLTKFPNSVPAEVVGTISLCLVVQICRRSCLCTT